MRPVLFAIFAGSCLVAPAARALEVRFFPGERIYAYEASAQHGASTVVVHNVAVLNNDAGPVDLNQVTIELLAGERTLDLRSLEKLARKYSDQPMDFADASVVSLASRLGVREVLTADRRDFRVYRLDNRSRFIDVLAENPAG